MEVLDRQLESSAEIRPPILPAGDRDYRPNSSAATAQACSLDWPARTRSSAAIVGRHFVRGSHGTAWAVDQTRLSILPGRRAARAHPHQPGRVRLPFPALRVDRTRKSPSPLAAARPHSHVSLNQVPHHGPPICRSPPRSTADAASPNRLALSLQVARSLRSTAAHRAAEFQRATAVDAMCLARLIPSTAALAKPLARRTAGIPF